MQIWMRHQAHTWEVLYLAQPGECHSIQPYHLLFSSPSCRLDPFLHELAFRPLLSSYWHFHQGFASPLRPSQTHFLTLAHHLLHSSLFSTLLLAVSPAELPLLPCALSPQGHLEEPVLLAWQFCLLSPGSLMHSPFRCWKTLPEACLGPMEASPANSTWQEKLFMPFRNLMIWAGSDQLPGKEFPRTSSQREKKENISLTYMDGLLTSPWRYPRAVIWPEAEELRQEPILCDSLRFRVLDVAGRCLVSLEWIELNFLGLEPFPLASLLLLIISQGAAKSWLIHQVKFLPQLRILCVSEWVKQIMPAGTEKNANFLLAGGTVRRGALNFPCPQRKVHTSQNPDWASVLTGPHDKSVSGYVSESVGGPQTDSFPNSDMMI